MQTRLLGLLEVNMVPIDLQLSEAEVDELRGQRAEAQMAAEERANAQALSDAYVKTQKAPEEGSGAELIGELTQQAMGG